MKVRLKTVMAGPGGVFKPDTELTDESPNPTHGTQELMELLKTRFAYRIGQEMEVEIVQPVETASLNPHVEKRSKGRPKKVS